MAYDRAITVFSPDGRLFEVEYAREAVKRGTTTVGVKFKDGVVLIVDKRLSSKLIEPESIEKIFKVNVVKINTINIKGKNKMVRNKKTFKPGYKKAIVTLKKGQSIDLSTGI